MELRALLRKNMYRENEKQLKIEDFVIPFGGELSPKNRWVVLSNLIPWDIVEDEYLTYVSKKLGAPACSARMAFGSIIIKERLSLTDRETVEMIIENPYLQYFIGLKEYQYEEPYDASMMVKFRKRFTAKGLKRINDEMHKREILSKPDDEDDSDDDFTSNNSDDAIKDSVETSENKADNHGKLLLDATAIPADITWPNDIKLLNSAREQTEKIIDKLYLSAPEGIKKPRTHRKTARKKYIIFTRKRRHTSKEIRKTRRLQLGYVERNLKSISKLNQYDSLEVLEARMYKLLLVCSETARQQRILHDSKSKRIDDRIVNIFQPHIRPIKRGKAQSPTEFGAKISISVVDGYTFIDNMSFDNYNESTDLISSCEKYKSHFGFYPESVHADKIYRNRNNIAWCKENNIRLSGPKLGRPSIQNEEEKEATKKIMRQDELDRIPVEGKFGQLKRRFGLDRIMTKLPETTISVIAITVFISNLEKVYKALILFTTLCILKSLNMVISAVYDDNSEASGLFETNSLILKTS